MGLADERNVEWNLWKLSLKTNKTENSLSSFFFFLLLVMFLFYTYERFALRLCWPNLPPTFSSRYDSGSNDYSFLLFFHGESCRLCYKFHYPYSFFCSLTFQTQMWKLCWDYITNWLHSFLIQERNSKLTWPWRNSSWSCRRVQTAGWDWVRSAIASSCWIDGSNTEKEEKNKTEEDVK